MPRSKPQSDSPAAAELAFRNSQRDRPLDIRAVRRFAGALLAEMGQAAELGFHFVSPREMARVNMEFLAHEGSTDIITFDHGSTRDRLHGECFISVADAVAQAKEFGTSWTEEIARYVIHGILHLQGYDDLVPEKRRVMKREENRLVRRAKQRFDLSAFARKKKAAPRKTLRR